MGLGVNAATNTGTLYLIDPQTGASSAIGTPGQIVYVSTNDQFAAVDLPDTTAAGYGFDFDPTTDRIRVTTSTASTSASIPSPALRSTATPRLQAPTPMARSTEGQRAFPHRRSPTASASHPGGLRPSIRWMRRPTAFSFRPSRTTARRFSATLSRSMAASSISQTPPGSTFLRI